MLESGTTLSGRYLLTGRLGGGGMGEVWRASDAVLGRTVAVKVLHPALMEDPRFAQRFQNEARAMATLTHPGVVDVYDYGYCSLADGRRVSFLVMEHIDGESLDRLLRRTPLAPGTAMALVAEVAEALAAAHAQGIVHRDVKPANLMIRTDGSVALTDFGISHSATAGQLTATGTVLCSAAYCAPEQASAGNVSPAVDIYALGVLAYECLSGRLPFEGDTPVQIIFKHLKAPVPPLPPEIPRGPRQVVARALEKDPERRWPSAAAMAEAARAAVEHPAVATVRGRRALTVTLSASAAILATLAIVALVWTQQRYQDAAEPATPRLDLPQTIRTPGTDRPLAPQPKPVIEPPIWTMPPDRPAPVTTMTVSAPPLAPKPGGRPRPVVTVTPLPRPTKVPPSKEPQVEPTVPAPVPSPDPQETPTPDPPPEPPPRVCVQEPCE